jgi:hypothetical protein
MFSALSKTTENKYAGWPQLLMFAVPATWEAEIGRIKVQGQFKQKVSETLFQPAIWHGGYTPVFPATWKA